MFSKYSVKKPFTVVVSVIMCILLGVISFTNMTTDLLPSIELPIMIVYTTYPGASAEKVELSVTNVLEEALSTTSDLENITSVSSDNLSMVILEFAEDTNMDSASIDISGKIDMVKGYFDDMVQSPVIMQINPNMLPIMMIAVDGDGMSEEEISRFVEDVIEPELKKTQGLATVTATGIIENEILIQLSQEKIDAVNDLVLKNVDDELYKTKKELVSAQNQLLNGQKELENGLNELENKKNETINQLASTTTELNSANSSLQALLVQETVQNTNKAALEAELKGLKDAKDQLEQAIANIQVTKNGLISIPEDNLLGTISAGNEAIQLLMNQFSLTDNNSIKDLKDALTLSEQGLQLQLDGVNATLNTRESQINAELNNIKTELMASSMMKTELEKQVDQLKKGITELEKGKLVAINELTKAEIQISNSKSTLKSSLSQVEDGLKQLEEARDKAYQAADLQGVITTSLISQMLKAENFNMPTGYMNSLDGTSMLVKVGEEFKTIEEIEDLVLFSFDIPGLEEVKLSDLAYITKTNNADELYAKVNGNNGVVLSLQKTSTTSTATVCNRINDKIDALNEQYEQANITVLMDQGVYIDLIIDSVLNNLIMGGLLAILILFIFLKDIKPTLIIALSIPISLMFAIVLMYFSGVTLNIISLSGLALGVGMLVDNSIVVIENIYQLRMNGVSPTKAAITGAKQVSAAIFSSTLTTICVFLPILFATGLAKQLFVDMGLTIAYSLVASLIVAITLVPAMASKMLVKEKQIKHNLFDKVIDIYERSLSRTLNHKFIMLALVALLFVFSIYKVTTMPLAFIPESDGEQISMTMTSNDDDATQDDIRALSDKIISNIKDIEDIDAVGAIESSMLGSLTGGSNGSMSFYIILDENKNRNVKEIASDIMKANEGLPCTLDISTSNMNLDMLGGSGIAINLYGNEIDELLTIGNNIKDYLKDVEGIKDITVGNDSEVYETRIIVDKNEAMKYGLTVAQVYADLAERLKTEVNATKVSLDNTEYQIVVAQDDSKDLFLEDLNDYTLKGTVNQEEVDVNLMDIVSLEKVLSSSSISHDNQQRTISVQLTIQDGYNTGLVSRYVKATLEKFEIQNGYSYSISGESESINDTLIELVKMILLAIAFIYLIMVAQFQSLLSPFIVMFTIPLAFTGGLLALILTGSDLSVISALGFLVLSGIVVNNGIVFIDATNQLRDEGLGKKEALLLTGRQRIRPILMTAMTTILGLSTMALGLGQGAEMMAPMAIVTIGGLIYATFMTLYIVPILYDLMHSKKIVKVEAEFDEKL